MTPFELDVPGDVIWLTPRNVIAPTLGPIPEQLLTVAALHRDNEKYLIALALYVEIQRYRQCHFPFRNDVCKALGITARQKQRGLDELVHAGLIDVYRRSGRTPEVIIQNAAWFDQLPQFVGWIGVHNATTDSEPDSNAPPAVLSESGDRKCPIEYPLATFLPITVDMALDGFLQHQQTQLRCVPAHLRFYPEKWEPIATAIRKICGDRSVFSITALQLRTAQTHVREVSPAIVANKTWLFVRWLYNHGYLCDRSMNHMEAMLPPVVDLRRELWKQRAQKTQEAVGPMNPFPKAVQ